MLGAVLIGPATPAEGWAEKIYWVEPSGEVHDIGSLPISLSPGKRGFLMPPVDVQKDVIPFQAGSRVRNVRVVDRELDLPMLVIANSKVELYSYLDLLTKWFDPIRGVGKIRVMRADGIVVREINCRLQSGFEGDEAADETAGWAWRKMVFVMSAADPYWYASDPIVYTWTDPVPTTTFFPFFPLSLSEAEVFSRQSVNNPGDVETFPVWTIFGPATGPQIKNVNNGKTLVSNAVIPSGGKMIIDTRPNIKTITDQDGGNLFGTVGLNPSLWTLPAGNTTVEIDASDIDINTKVVLSFQPRYRTS